MKTEQLEDKTVRKEKRTRILKNAVLLAGLAAVVFSSLVYYKNEEKAIEEEQNNAVIGVHVKGAVKNSGYYEVPYSTRVKDLGDVAGGFDENVDLDGVNLAAYVKDGEEIYFPYKGSAERGGYNLNSVSIEQLLTVSGVGETTAQKIINYRENNGKYKEVSELITAVGKSKYEEIRENFYVE